VPSLDNTATDAGDRQRAGSVHDSPEKTDTSYVSEGDVYWTPTCEAQFRGYTGARRRAVAVVRNAVRRKRCVPDWYNGKRAMQGIDELVYELKVTSGDRLLVRAVQDDLYLVAIGDHGVTDRYARTAPGIRRADFCLASRAPRYFLPGHDAPLFIDVDAPT